MRKLRHLSVLGGTGVKTLFATIPLALSAAIRLSSVRRHIVGAFVDAARIICHVVKLVVMELDVADKLG